MPCSFLPTGMRNICGFCHFHYIAGGFLAFFGCFAILYIVLGAVIALGKLPVTMANRLRTRAESYCRGRRFRNALRLGAGDMPVLSGR